MTREDEVTLFERAKSGDAAACWRLVDALDGALVGLARGIVPPEGLEPADVAQEARIGLAELLSGTRSFRYDPELGSLWTGLRLYLSRGLVRWRYRCDGVRYTVVRRLPTIRAAEARLWQERGAPPSVQQIAEGTGLPPDLVREALEAVMERGEASEPPNEEGPDGRLDAIWHVFLRLLPPPTRAHKAIVLQVLFTVLGLTWEEVARVLQDPAGVASRHAFGEGWGGIAGELGLPNGLPRDWAGVVALFATPPPTLPPVPFPDGVDPGLLTAGLRTWNARILRRLSEHPGAFRDALGEG